jgi:predicted TIM-barrel fold metal-dependent hydrolase
MTNSTDTSDWLISVDDHVIEPGTVWTDRLSSKDREMGPHLEVHDGNSAWVYEGRVFPHRLLHAAAGRTKEEFSPRPVSYEDMRPGCYDPLARVEDMNQDGVLASLCFPSFPRFCGQTFYEARDHGLGLRCVQAYNDWMIDEWSGRAPGRFIPMIILPLWDPVAGAAEIERCAEKGAKAITFPENPTPLGLPSIHASSRYWDPVLSAANDTKMPLCTHIGSSSQMPATSKDAPMIVHISVQTVNLMLTTADWVFSGAFDRFPDLKLCLSEGGIGWIPYMLEHLDYTWERQRHWAASGLVTLDDAIAGQGGGEHPESALNFDTPPSEIFRNHVYGCFIDEQFGVDVIDYIGIDNVMIETDYPHTDSTWPHSREIASERLKKRSDEERFQILQGNAMRVFNFEPAKL